LSANLPQLLQSGPKVRSRSNLQPLSALLACSIASACGGGVGRRAPPVLYRGRTRRVAFQIHERAEQFVGSAIRGRAVRGL